MSEPPETEAAPPPAGQGSTEVVPPAGDTIGETLREALRTWVARLRSGELGALPIFVGLAALALLFGSLDENFYTERNFVNLLLQTAGIATIAMGVVFVLLIAEIDLSVGFVSGVGAVIMTLLLRPAETNWPWWAAIAVALVTTSAIGLLHGLIITKARVPSFVVTLAGLLTWSGVVLILTTQASSSGTIRIQDDVVLGIANDYLPDVWGWLLLAGIVTAYGALELAKVRARKRRDVSSRPVVLIALQLVAIAAIGALAVWYANKDRGVPVVAVIVGSLYVFWTFIANRTRFGRHVYAVGGNAEAARRAGINVDRVRIAVFMIAGFMAGVGGIILASRLRSVDPGTGGGPLLLNAIAAAVIGGTSLFGGHGRVLSALLGAAVIGTVANGMDLLNLASGYKLVITGGVLLAAVLVDAFAKRARAASGVA
ncbi:MAG: Xylose transporter, permease protein XylH [Gaiellaceae bacterium]|nr:Xylose transporter, permease protein XylH [Gaiellaceae bacterium]